MNKQINIKDYLNDIGYFKLDKENCDLKNVPYSKGGIISNPLIHYLREVDAYESYASGADDFGVLKKSFFDIPSGRFIKILPLTPTMFQISWVVNPFDSLIDKIMLGTNYDFRVFELMDYKVNTKIINLSFNSFN